MIEDAIADMWCETGIGQRRNAGPSEVMEAPVRDVLVTVSERLLNGLFDVTERCDRLASASRKNKRVVLDPGQASDCGTNRFSEMDNVRTAVLRPVAGNGPCLRLLKNVQLAPSHESHLFSALERKEQVRTKARTVGVRSLRCPPNGAQFRRRKNPLSGDLTTRSLDTVQRLVTICWRFTAQP